MTIYKFETIEEFYNFVNEVTAAGVRPKLRDGFRVEVPDDYSPEGKPEVEEPPKPPSTSADKGEWEAYAREQGYDPSDKTKAEIIKMVEGA